ncbi:MAG: tRNA epoxyqueuosine(34) reductase QueG [Candidatus Puniceispirillaceae bacterium]
MAAAGEKLRRWLYAAAAQAGFAGVHITAATLPEEVAGRLNAFIASGHQGDMDWLADTAARRASPRAMWPEARSAIILTMNYGPDHDPMDNLAAASRGNVSVYARGRDYHEVIKGRLKQLAGQFASRSGADVKVFVDTAPLMEKPLAAQAGAGWQGKHTNLVSRAHGSWLFLGTILTDAELPPDSAESDHCGSCTRCLDICPTRAFPAPYQLDARRCISYLTIEHKGQIPVEFRAAMGNRIFGCDDCLAVCPWNKYAARAAEAKFHGPGAMPALSELLALDDAAFRKMFAGSPVRRAGHERFLRNVLVAAGNSGDAGLVPAVEALLAHRSPLVRGMAVWALRQLLDEESLRALRATLAPHEGEATVLGEWG